LRPVCYRTKPASSDDNIRQPRALLGISQTSACHQERSAFGGQPDPSRLASDVRVWHKADIQRLLLWIAFQPAWMVAEIPLTILLAALRVAEAPRISSISIHCSRHSSGAAVCFTRQMISC